MKHIIIFIPIIIFLAGCNSSDHQKYAIPASQQIEKSDAVVDLNSSANIIVQLLKEQKLANILAPEAKNAPETIDVLMKNFSPAEMAFESEVLNFKGPSMLLFYDETDPINMQVLNGFHRMAENNADKAKFVIIEVSKLFKIAEQGDITAVPTFVLINNRKELGRLENPQSELIDTELQKLIADINRQ